MVTDFKPLFTRPPLPDAQNLVASSEPRASSDLSMTEGLIQQSTEHFERLRANTQSIEDFQASPEATANVSAIRDFDRAPGQRPSELLSALMGVEGDQRSILSESAQRETAGLNALANLYDKQASDARQQEQDIRADEQFAMDKEAHDAKMLSDYGMVRDSSGVLRQATNEDYLTTPDGKQLNDEQKINASLRGTSAVAKASSQDLKLWQTLVKASAKTQEAKEGLAEEILKQGGMDEYRKNFDVIDLMSTDEVKSQKLEQDLMSNIELGLQILEREGGVRGVGALEGFIGGIAGGVFASDEGKELRSHITAITGKKLKEMSGTTVSESEYKRLTDGGFLPKVGDSEASIQSKLEILRDVMAGNREIFNRAKMEGIDVGTAYEKYKGELLGLGSGAENIEVSDAIQKLKDAGYSDADIAEYKKAKGL